MCDGGGGRDQVERVEGACEGRAATEGDLRRSQQQVLTLVSQRDALSALARGLIAESVRAVRGSHPTRLIKEYSNYNQNE